MRPMPWYGMVEGEGSDGVRSDSGFRSGGRCAGRRGALPPRLDADVRPLLSLPGLQRQTGRDFVLNALIEADRIALLSGSPQAVPVPTDSGQPHDVHRCPRCLTAVWSEYGRRRNLRFVRVGTLDNPTALPPDVHIYTRSKLPWVALPPGKPAFEESISDSATLWPAESLARRQAALR